MNTACRDLNNFQWRLVANAIAKCSLPIFVKLGNSASSRHFIVVFKTVLKTLTKIPSQFLRKYADGVVILDLKKRIWQTQLWIPL